MTMNGMRRAVVAAMMVVVAVLAGAQSASAQQATVSRVAAFGTDVYTVWVSAGWHRVVVDGDGDTDLDLYITDAAGRPLASDDDNTDYCIGRFYLQQSGYVRIRIENLGAVYNRYRISVE